MKVDYNRKYAYYSRFTIAVVKWLNASLLGGVGHLHLSERFLNKYLTILKSRGKKEAIRFCKDRRAAIYSWLATTSLKENNIEPTQVGGLPKDLRFLKYLKGQSVYPIIRLLLSTLYFSRGLELPVTINVESITTPASFALQRELLTHIDDFWYALGCRYRHTVPRRVYWKRFHFSTKSGPNGQAMWSAITDLLALPENLVDSIKAVGGKKLASKIDNLQRFGPVILPFFGTTGSRFRKVSAIADQEGKTREVAILDYWSQSALKGLHQYLFSYLRRIPQDCTFDQGSFSTKLNWSGKEPFYSVDLTTATDRFPIELISEILKVRFTNDYVNHWQNIMVGYPFESHGGPLRYAVGNPMGAYSSWNSFAIAHHYVVYYCCRELGINWTDAPYVLLGDDIVIKHSALAKKYMEVMTSIGVEFSLQKTHVSPLMYEFAKRIIHEGVEVTPFPTQAMWQSRKAPLMALNVFVNELRKGWCTQNGVPSILSDLYSKLGLPSRLRRKREESLFIAYQMLIGLSGRVDALEAVRPIVEKHYPTILAALDRAEGERGNVYSSILKNTVCNVFSESVESKGKDKPLGLIAENLVILITGLEGMDIDPSDLITSIPIAVIHGYVEEKYLQVMREARIIDTLLDGDWKLTLRALTIPESDQTYYCRNQDIKIMAAGTLGKALRAGLDMLVVYPQLI